MKINSVLKLIILAFSVAILTSCNTPLQAQEENTEHTIRLNKNSKSPKANIEQLHWLSGSWQGEGLGSSTEEIWSTPKANSMMGMFQMYNAGQVIFYELCQIVEHNESLILKLKHFNSDLSGWEEKGETVDFPLVKLEEQTAWFEGLTYKRTGNELKVWVAMEDKEGKVEEGVFTFKLVP